MTDVADGKQRAAPRGTASYVRYEIFTVPNLFTGFRLVAGFGIYSYTDSPVVVLVLASLGAVSDILDGWLARRLRQATNFGKRFDQCVDLVFGLSLVFFVYKWEGLTVYNVPVLGGIIAYAIAMVCLRATGWTANSSGISKLRISLQFSAGIAIIATYALPFTSSFGVIKGAAYCTLWYSVYLMWKSLVRYIGQTDT